MFDVTRTGPTDIHLKGRLDASQAHALEAVCDSLTETCAVHFDGLDYISSVGLSILLHTQQRLSSLGGELKLTGLSPHIRMVFDLAGFNTVFHIA